MHTNAKLATVALALALSAHVNVARAQTDGQSAIVPAPMPQSMPGTIILAPPRPAALPANRRPDDDTCPAGDIKKLDLIG